MAGQAGIPASLVAFLEIARRPWPSELPNDRLQRAALRAAAEPERSADGGTVGY